MLINFQVWSSYLFISSIPVYFPASVKEMLSRSPTGCAMFAPRLSSLIRKSRGRFVVKDQNVPIFILFILFAERMKWFYIDINVVRYPKGRGIFSNLFASRTQWLQRVIVVIFPCYGLII